VSFYHQIFIKIYLNYPLFNFFIWTIMIFQVEKIVQMCFEKYLMIVHVWNSHAYQNTLELSIFHFSYLINSDISCRENERLIVQMCFEKFDDSLGWETHTHDSSNMKLKNLIYFKCIFNSSLQYNIINRIH